MAMMIEVNNLTKYYGATLAINQLNFEVAPGEIVGFLGPNAAGKSTTLRILAGFLAPTAGSARINGRDCSGESLAARRSLGYLPESVALYTDLTVTQFLRFAAQAKGVAAKDETREMERVMGDCGLTEVAKSRIGVLSKGYRQRVGLAQALINQPPLLILDEPTIGLDPSQIVEIRQLIRDLAGSHTIILSTHILPEASQLCQRVIIINRGHIIASDTPANLSRQMGGAFRVSLAIKGPAREVKSALQGVPGVESVEALERGRFLVQGGKDGDPRPDLARVVVEKGWDLLELKSQEFTLEEVFLNLVTKEEAEEHGRH